MNLNEINETISTFLFQIYFHKNRIPTNSTQINPIHIAEIIGNHLKIVSCAVKQIPLLRKEIDFLSVRILSLLILIFPNDRQR
jgi:hypothetical protein